MTRPIAAASAALALTLAASPARSQEHDWEARFAFELHDFTSDSAPWSTWIASTLAVERKLARASVRVEAIETRRFDEWDATLGAETWAELWPRAYGNARLQITPDAATRASWDAAIAVYQGVGEGWELGGGWRRQRYVADDAELDLISLNLARYLDGLYLRGGADLVRRSGIEGAVATMVARWYFDPPADLVEVGFTWGEGSELAAPGPRVSIGRRGQGHARFELFPWPYLGLGLAAEVVSFERLPTRHGFSAAIKARW